MRRESSSPRGLLKRWVFVRSPSMPQFPDEVLADTAFPMYKWTLVRSARGEPQRPSPQQSYTPINNVSTPAQTSIMHHYTLHTSETKKLPAYPQSNLTHITIHMEAKSHTRRPLGKNGPMVPRIGFGTMGIGFPCSRTIAPIPDPERLALLDHAYEVGCTFWDTSDFYVRMRSCIPQNH